MIGCVICYSKARLKIEREITVTLVALFVTRQCNCQLQEDQPKQITIIVKNTKMQ